MPAHTLRDANPPINPNSQGEQVSEATWNYFRYGASSLFNGNYNYTYTAYSGGSITVEAFTKNGYYMQSSAGRLYYERISGNRFYCYISTSQGYLREETTLNLRAKYTQRIVGEIYVHMSDYANYEYDDYDGTYRYLDYGMGMGAKFQGGYLTCLYYSMGMNYFEIDDSFQTTIEIPESYYYI